MKMEHVPGKNKGTITLYALSTCGWCAKTKDLLRELGVDHSYVFVDLLPPPMNWRLHCRRSRRSILQARFRPWSSAGTG